jgi:heptose-I-phosphate ethanolaminephosphotransferase
MEGEQTQPAFPRAGAAGFWETWGSRSTTLLIALLPFAVLLAAKAFGNPLYHWLHEDPGPALHYLLLGSIWSALALVLRPHAQGRRAAFYLVLFGLLLHLERTNFGAVSLPGALAWTSVLWLALVLELLVVRRLATSTALAAAFSTAYHCMLACAPLAVLAYNASLDVALGMDAVLAIFQTDPHEARDFIAEYIQPKYVLVVALVPVLVLANNWRQVHRGLGLKPLLLSGLAAALALPIIYQIPDHPKAQLLSLVKKSYTYHKELAEFREMRALRASGSGGLIAATSGPAETFVLVIGESHNRNHMSAHGYFRKTTPWVDEMARDRHFLLFRNAYSNHTHTMPALALALTEASQYNDKPHYKSPSLLDVAKKAGFNTYWITNQVSLGGWDNFVTALAEVSDHHVRLNKHVGQVSRSNVHDGAAIKVLQRMVPQLDSRTDNLVVIHLMGNHASYCDRFPEEFAVFNGPDKFLFGNVVSSDGFAHRVDCYDNSVLYNDHVMAGLFEQARRIENLAGFIYFADHGQAVVAGAGHNSAKFRHEMTHIPMYAWFSDRYLQSRSDRFEELSRRRDEYFTNDLIYDTMLGVMGIETPHYDPENDLSTRQYALVLDRARTLHGEKRVSDDPAIVQTRFTRGLPEGRVIAHRINSLGKLGDAGRAGFDGVELDLVVRLTEDGGYFEVGRNDEIRTHGKLEGYLAAAEEWGFRKLWLDIKNLEEGNYRQALEELERLAVLYPRLKEIAIVESSTPDAWFAEFAARGWHTSYYYYFPHEELLELIEAADAAANERRAEEIAATVRMQRAQAVSFEVRLYPFVKAHLERHLESHIVFHAWDTRIRAWEPQARQMLEQAPYYGDGRLRTIIVRIDSEFHI